MSDQSRERVSQVHAVGQRQPVTAAPTDERVQTILETVDGSESVLDIGCVQHSAEKEADPNWLHQHLYTAADDVTGIDILEDDVRDLAGEGYNVLTADAESFDLDRTFETIVAGELIEHLSNPGQFLTSVRDHLEDDGQLVLTTPNAWSVAYLKRLAFPGEVHCNEEHTCWYDSRTLRQLLERHGFEVEIEYVTPQNTTPTPAPQIAYRLGMKRLGALSLLAVATPSGGDA